MQQRIIIPEKIYAGVHVMAKGSSPLAAVTAWGEDSAAKGRMSTVDSNSKDAVDLPNTPTVGFVIENSVWKDEIRVRDPRGFSVNLKSDSVISLVKDCTVVNGMIVEPLVYARSNGNNLLLSVQSQQYHQARLLTEIANSKESWKNARFGNRVTLTNGTQGIYLGRYFSVCQEGGSWVNHKAPDASRFSIESSAKYVILKDENVRHYRKSVNKQLIFHGSAKLARIDSEDEITAQQAEMQINQLLHDPTCEIERGWSMGIVAAVSKQSDFLSLALTVKHIDIDDNVETLVDRRQVVIDSLGYLGLVTTIGRNNSATVLELDQSHLKNNRFVYVYRKDSRGNITAVSHTVPLSNLSDLKCLQLEFSTALGNQLTIV